MRIATRVFARVLTVRLRRERSPLQPPRLPAIGRKVTLRSRRPTPSRSRMRGQSPSIWTDWAGFGGIGSLKVIPVVLFLALVIVLVMTFITLSIPEFPGALASSILIVTLIIYGAATLLKA